MSDIAIISTDFHLQSKNLNSVYEAHEQIVSIAENRGIKTHIWLGDIFDSRVSQREEVLNTLTRIIELYDRAGQLIIAIPGNHDKTIYSSKTSFLDPYKHHPSFDLITEQSFRLIEKIPCYFIPFFEEGIWLEEFKKIDPEKNAALFTHIAFDGSVNNDGTKVGGSIKPSLFTKFKIVAAGHYHDFQEVSQNIVHLGSLQQNNFGEDEAKGIWILDSNLDYDLIQLESCQGFKKLKIDLNETSQKQAVAIIEKFKKENEGSRLRVEIIGDSAAIKAFDGSELKKQGIDIKKKFSEVDYEDTEEGEIKTASIEEVKEKFKAFCKENDYEYEEGISILELAVK